MPLFNNRYGEPVEIQPIHSGRLSKEEVKTITWIMSSLYLLVPSKLRNDWVEKHSQYASTIFGLGPKWNQLRSYDFEIDQIYPKAAPDSQCIRTTKYPTEWDAVVDDQLGALQAANDACESFVWLTKRTQYGIYILRVLFGHHTYPILFEYHGMAHPLRDITGNFHAALTSDTAMMLNELKLTTQQQPLYFAEPLSLKKRIYDDEAKLRFPQTAQYPASIAACSTDSLSKFMNSCRLHTGGPNMLADDWRFSYKSNSPRAVTLTKLREHFEHNILREFTSELPVSFDGMINRDYFKPSTHPLVNHYALLDTAPSQSLYPAPLAKPTLLDSDSDDDDDESEDQAMLSVPFAQILASHTPALTIPRVPVQFGVPLPEYDEQGEVVRVTGSKRSSPFELPSPKLARTSYFAPSPITAIDDDDDDDADDEAGSDVVMVIAESPSPSSPAAAASPAPAVVEQLPSSEPVMHAANASPVYGHPISSPAISNVDQVEVHRSYTIEQVDDLLQSVRSSCAENARQMFLQMLQPLQEQYSRELAQKDQEIAALKESVQAARDLVTDKLQPLEGKIYKLKDSVKGARGTARSAMDKVQTDILALGQDINEIEAKVYRALELVDEVNERTKLEKVQEIVNDGIAMVEVDKLRAQLLKLAETVEQMAGDLENTPSIQNVQEVSKSCSDLKQTLDAMQRSMQDDSVRLGNFESRIAQVVGECERVVRISMDTNSASKAASASVETVTATITTALELAQNLNARMDVLEPLSTKTIQDLELLNNSLQILTTEHAATQAITQELKHERDALNEQYAQMNQIDELELQETALRMSQECATMSM